MVKINCCDICHKDNKLTKTQKYMKVTRRPDLRLDYCTGCKDKIPKDMDEYTMFVYGINGIKIDIKQAKELNKR